MQIVSPHEMQTIEKNALSQGCKEDAFMEQAGKGIFAILLSYLQKHSTLATIWLLCGKGNNGGDAFVAGRYLLTKGFSVVAVQPEKEQTLSALCLKNRQAFIDLGGKVISKVDHFETGGLIVDGLFGTGYKGALAEPYLSLVQKANSSKLPIFAIDIPSGLNGETGKVLNTAIYANTTIYLGLPKTGFFLDQGWNHVGKLTAVDFGLPKALISGMQTPFQLITQDFVAANLPSIQRNRHKYQAGFVVGFAGSPAMPGAAILASLAAFRGGCGIVKLLHQTGMETTLAASPFELIKISYDDSNQEQIRAILNKAGAGFLGPGLGQTENALRLIENFIQNAKMPCVIDADALMLYAKSPYTLPNSTVFTPHLGEMQKLLGAKTPLELTESQLKICQHYAEEKKVTLVLKGSPTFIFHPSEPIWINPQGDPGMATAGSGDVLTGLIASLIAQGLSCHQAAIVGTYFHGFAGQLAVESRGTSRGLMATDIVNHLADAYAQIEKFTHLS